MHLCPSNEPALETTPAGPSPHQMHLPWNWRAQEIEPSLFRTPSQRLAHWAPKPRPIKAPAQHHSGSQALLPALTTETACAEHPAHRRHALEALPGRRTCSAGPAHRPAVPGHHLRLPQAHAPPSGILPPHMPHPLMQSPPEHRKAVSGLFCAHAPSSGDQLHLLSRLVRALPGLL